MYSFSNIAVYKINLKYSVAFVHTNNEQTEKEYRKTIPFTIVSKKIKFLVINLTKDVNGLLMKDVNIPYKENYEPLKKEIKEGYRRWKDLPCS
jgi:hypothetical protein